MALRSIKRILWWLVKALVILSLLTTAAIAAFVNLAPTFGANPSGESLS